MSRKIGPPAGISAIACPPGTLPGGPIRTRFFDGMFLSQADLENEQRYFRLKRRLTNRALGQGVVWGLRLEWKEKRRTFTLSPGYALDCCGNDLVVECPVETNEQQLWAQADPALRAGRLVYGPPPVKGEPPSPPAAEPAPPAEEPATPAAEPAAAARRTAVAAPAPGQDPVSKRVLRACVVLQYVECPEEARPVHRDACAGPSGYCEPSRIRESTRLLLVPPPADAAPTPPELFLEELYRWRDGLPSDVRAALFPDQGATPAPGSGVTPLSLRATVPGASPATTTLVVPASGSVSAGAPLEADQSLDPTRPTGVVTFELLPKTGWSLTAGRVTDQSRVVETVTPPAAPSMYWALDVALGDDESGTTGFEFVLDEIELSQTFGGTEHGRVRARVTGIVTAVASGSSVKVTLEKLTISTEKAEVVEEVDGQGCLRELVPWGWTVDPANGSKIARVLVLASLYAFLSETVRRASSPALQKLATILYAIGWYALFGVNPVAAVEEEHRKKLAEHLLALYRRWCEGFVYPGPRCTDDHHGVYLGCVELTPNGAVRSFDMWGHRRHVLLGPLVNHWAAQLGIAPLDVVVSRFVSAMCCLSGLPPIVLPAFEGKLAPGLGNAADGRFHVGTVNSVKEYAKLRGAPVTWVQPSELPLKMSQVFLARAEARVSEVLATTLPDGGTIAIAVPGEKAGAKGSRIREDVLLALRQGDDPVRASARQAVADFVVALFRLAPVNAASDETAAGNKAFVEVLAKSGTTLADAAEGGPEAMIARAGKGDSPEIRDAADDLDDLVERAIERSARTTVKTLGPKFGRADFGVTANHKKLAAAIGGSKWLPKVTPAMVTNAALRVAKKADKV